jgi:hypothetical protein
MRAGAIHFHGFNLRLIAADAFLFVLSLLIASLWIAAIMMTAAIVATPFVGAFIFISKFVRIVAP